MYAEHADDGLLLPTAEPGCLARNVLLELSDSIRGGSECRFSPISLLLCGRYKQYLLAGMHYIEGGWPGSNPKDVEFFERARKELPAEAWARVVAFGRCARPLPPTPSGAKTTVCCIVRHSHASLGWRRQASTTRLCGRRRSSPCTLGYIYLWHPGLGIETFGLTLEPPLTACREVMKNAVLRRVARIAVSFVGIH